MRGRTGILLAALCLLAFLSTPRAVEEDTTEASVTYLAGSSIYVDAGRDDGLRLGDRLEVLQDGQVKAVLEVTYLSANRVSCKLVEGDGEVQVGDLVRFLPSGWHVDTLTRRGRAGGHHKIPRIWPHLPEELPDGARWRSE